LVFVAEKQLQLWQHLLQPVLLPLDATPLTRDCVAGLHMYFEI